jgi:type IV secretory pathway VirB2 component (pilin)
MDMSLRLRRLSRSVSFVVIGVLVATTASGQPTGGGSPWERAAKNLETTFTGPLAESLALVAIVVAGLMWMFGEGGAKRQIAGVVFGGGVALLATTFLRWLF